MSITEKFQKDKILAPFSTYQIGGKADWFLEATSIEDVAEAISWAEGSSVKHFIFGGGSNLLFSENGFRGLVIRIVANNLKVEGEKIIADAGLKIFALVKAAADAGLTGLEAWNGLPGTVGGAIFGNAGCFGLETKDILESAKLYIPGEGVVDKNADFFEYEYRNSKLKKSGEIAVLQGTFKLQKGEPEQIKAKMDEIAKLRITKQPPGSSTGSFFKNPEGDSAGRLIEAAGLKGEMMGRAQISPQHANFILNKGGATSKDILELAGLAQKKVKENFGIDLHREVVVVPEN